MTIRISDARRQLTEAYTAAMAALESLEGSPGVTDSDRPLLTPLSKVGEPLGISRTTAFQLADAGALATVEIPGVQGRFVRREDLDAFVAGLQVTKGRRRLRSTG